MEDHVSENTDRNDADSSELDPPATRWWERGASLVEYALLCALIAATAVTMLRYFQDETVKSFSESASAIVAAG